LKVFGKRSGDQQNSVKSIINFLTMIIFEFWKWRDFNMIPKSLGLKSSRMSILSGIFSNTAV